MKPRRPNGWRDRARRRAGQQAMRLGSEEATARRDASVGETDHCHNCGVVFVPADVPPVVITDGGSDNDDGTLVVRCYCGRECAGEAGFVWAGR